MNSATTSRPAEDPVASPLCQHETDGPIVSLTRFMMKRDYPRLEVIGRDYRFVWHGRWFGFRLCGRPEFYDETISFVSFGAFQLGGPDLLCSYRYIIEPRWPDGRPVGLGVASQGTIRELADSTPAAPAYQIDYENLLRMTLRFAQTAPHVRMTLTPLCKAVADTFTLPLTGQGIYTETWQNGNAAAYYAPGTQTGLRVAGQAAGAVSIAADCGIRGQSTVSCRVPAREASQWELSVLGPGDWPPATEQVGIAPAAVVPGAVARPVDVATLPRWENTMLKQRGWEVRRTAVTERVAGIYVTVPNGRHPLSQDPAGRLDYVENVFLDQVIESHAFPVIGLSRDGGDFSELNPRWLKLVERIHDAGLAAWMKPGDAELHDRNSGEALEAWVRQCFSVPAGQQVDGVRLCWEAVLSPWMTADLCLPNLDRLLEQPPALPMDAWPRVRETIVNAVADRFSTIIDAIRRHAPRATIDLECGDSAVFAKLLARHDNLGIMYMCYGPYPRVGDYLDLYASAAREQFRTQRVVLETDCYYTSRYDDLSKLYRQPAQAMYADEEIANMAQKHRHMNALSSQAAWAWGINICHTNAKFEAICQACERS